MSASSSPSEPGTTPDEYRQRALLWADLGRYDDAAEELAAGLGVAPGDAALLATLARVHLAADQPAEALEAADRAVAAAPDTLDPMVVRAMALTDNQRYTDAAQVAATILRRWPDDPYAQRTGAGLLGESRNGQEALNAAWHGVRVAPADAEAHLVLAVVAARLRLFDLAQRAYGEALDLDEAVGEAQGDVGIVRFERRRWARALESLADEASLTPPESPSTEPGYPSPFPRPYEGPEPAGTAAVGDTPDSDPHPRPRRKFFGRRSTDAPDSEAGTPGGWAGFFGTRGADAGGGSTVAGPTGPGSPGPKSAGSEPAEPASVGPEAAGPESAGPEPAGPGSAGPGSAGPGSAEPKSAGPEPAGPGSAGPGSAGPEPAGSEAAGPEPAGSGVTASGSAGPTATGSGAAGVGASGAATAGVGGPGRTGGRSGAGTDRGGGFPPPGISRPTGSVLNPSGRSAGTVRQAVLYGANGTLIAAVLTAGMTFASPGASRVWGGMVGVIVLVAVVVWLTRHLREPLGTVLARLRRSDRALAVATYAVFLGPVLILVYAAVGGLVPLVAAMAVAAAAELLVLTRR